MSLFLGIDMGGTAARWAVIDETHVLIDRGSAPGATGHLLSEAERRRFEAAIGSIAAALTRRPIDGVRAGITGLGPRTESDANAIIGTAFGTSAGSVVTSDDITLAFRAAFSPGEGHLVSAGTGSVGMHMRADGSVIRVGGRGILVDDAGSGSWIALNALDRLYRLIDETGSATGAEGLARAIFAAIGGNSWDDVRAFIYGGDRGRIGALAPAVAEAARAGDRIAASILDAAAAELARLAMVLTGRGGKLPIAFIGGVLDLDPILKRTILQAILKKLPNAIIAFPKLDLPLSAAALALELAVEGGT
jgi:glucosamine kinase